MATEIATLLIAINAETIEAEKKVELLQETLDELASRIYTAGVEVTAKEAFTQLAALEKELQAVRKGATADVEANAAAALSKIGMVESALDDITSHPWEVHLSVDAASSLLGGISPGMLTGLIGESGGLLGAGGGTDGGGGLGKLLGFGMGPGGLAGMGTLGGLAGFSVEGLLGTGLGVSGSLLGAGLGAGLLGLGAGGTMAVGMGTDYAGLGQAANDIKAVYQAQTQLNKAMFAYQTAVKTYGAGSTAARYALTNLHTAQINLNTALSSFSPKARTAVSAAVAMAYTLKALFDTVTGQAEALGAKIITAFMTAFKPIIKIIGTFATQNMAIIQKALGPFFQWLDTGAKSFGGLSIFTHLEQQFTKDLPTGMTALINGFELFAKTITIASSYLGPFLTKIADFLKRMNGKTFGEFAEVVQDLIGLFLAWFPLVLKIGGVLLHLFEPAVGLGKNLAEGLTKILTRFEKWLELGKTQTVLHRLFSAHNMELITGFLHIITAILPLVESFLTAFVQIEAVFRAGLATALTAVAKALGAIANSPAAPLLGWAVAIGLVAKGISPLLTGLMKLPTVMLKFATWVGNLGTGIAGLAGRFSSAWSTITTGVGVFALNMQSWAGKIGEFFSGIGTKVATLATTAGTFFINFIRQIGEAIVAAATWVADFAVDAATFIAENVAEAAAATAAFIAENIATLGIAAAIAALIAFVVYAATHWHQVWTDIKNWALDAWHFLDTYVFHPLDNFFSSVWHAFLTSAKAIWTFVWTSNKDILLGVWHVVWTDILSPLWNFLKTSLLGALHTLHSVWTTVWNGLKSIITAVWSFIKPIISAITSAISHISSAIGGFLSTVGKIGSGVGSFFTGHATILGVHLATGGYVTQPTYALVGEAGPELVLPLYNPSRMAEILGVSSSAFTGQGVLSSLGGLVPQGALSGSLNLPPGLVQVHVYGNATPRGLADSAERGTRTGLETLTSALSGHSVGVGR